MRFFNRKPKLHLDEFCRDFYDNHILYPKIAGINVSSYFDTVWRFVIEVDPSFVSVDPQSFVAEMNVLRFEVFSLACLHAIGDKQAVMQSEFTKRYLEQCGRSDIWEGMGLYNKAISHSTILEHDPDTPSGRDHHAFLDTLRFQTFLQWQKQGFDGHCIARVVNRLSTEGAWKKSITPGFLMLTLCERLGCEVNEEGRFRLVATIVGLYKGAREALSDVRIES